MEDEANLKGPNKVGLFHGYEDIADGKGNFKDGWRDGLWEIYWDDGTLCVPLQVCFCLSFQKKI